MWRISVNIGKLGRRELEWEFRLVTLPLLYLGVEVTRAVRVGSLPRLTTNVDSTNQRTQLSTFMATYVPLSAHCMLNSMVATANWITNMSLLHFNLRLELTLSTAYNIASKVQKTHLQVCPLHSHFSDTGLMLCMSNRQIIQVIYLTHHYASIHWVTRRLQHVSIYCKVKQI